MTDSVPAGNTRAYALFLNRCDSMWVDDPGAVLDNLRWEADEEGLPFDEAEVLKRLTELKPGEPPFELGNFTVEVRMVDKEWLENLPEHTGW